MITEWSKKVLKRYQKKINKHYEKMQVLINEMKDDGMFKSETGLEYAERDLENWYKWMNDAIKSKRSFAQKYNDYNAKMTMEQSEKEASE